MNNQLIDDFFSGHENNSIEVGQFKNVKRITLSFSNSSIAIIHDGELFVNYRSIFGDMSNKLYNLLDDIFVAWCPNYPPDIKPDIIERNVWVCLGKYKNYRFTDRQMTEIYDTFWKL